jgi:hypothetical protein
MIPDTIKRFCIGCGCNVLFHRVSITDHSYRHSCEYHQRDYYAWRYGPNHCNATTANHKEELRLAKLPLLEAYDNRRGLQSFRFHQMAESSTSWCFPMGNTI